MRPHRVEAKSFTHLERLSLSNNLIADTSQLAKLGKGTVLEEQREIEEEGDRYVAVGG